MKRGLRRAQALLDAADGKVITAACHRRVGVDGSACPLSHQFTEAEAAWLLDQFSEGDWEDGPRCLRLVLDAKDDLA